MRTEDYGWRGRSAQLREISTAVEGSENEEDSSSGTTEEEESLVGHRPYLNPEEVGLC